MPRALPYPNRGTVSADDLAWLEHSLLFLFKAPRDFGARLWNGLYYRMTLTDAGIVGTPGDRSQPHQRTAQRSIDSALRH